jgi:catechol 2,3-dioxygenase-like lactoylglutathione lyase family enzyme
MKNIMSPRRLLTLLLILVAPGLLQGAPNATLSPQPRLDHIAVWVMDLDKTTNFLLAALGWKRHPLEFGINQESKVFTEFGGMKLDFVDANGVWLELVEPTTPGPGMDLLHEKGNGSLIELDISIGHVEGDFDREVASLRSKGIEPIGMDGKSMPNDGRSTLWVLKDGERLSADERLAYIPPGLSRGTAIELYWEYPSGVVLLRDATWTDTERSPKTGPRVDHVVLLAADLEKTATFYTNVLGMKRHPMDSGIRRDWMGVADRGHAWIDSDGKGLWIEVVSPASSGRGEALLKSKAFGDGSIVELGVEVENVDSFYDRMKAKGITMTGGDSRPLPLGKKAITLASGDRYSYFPLDKSEGMRIMVYQRGTQATSIFRRRDDTTNR